MNHDVSLLPKMAYSRTVQTAQFPIVHMVDWVLCQGVRHATFIPYPFVNWQELWPTSCGISVSCVPTTCPSCWSRGLTALSLVLDCHCLASDTRWQFRGFADLVSLSCLNVFLCSSVQLNSVSCRVRQCISSICSAKRVRNFDKLLTNPFSVCMLISLA